MHNEEDELFPHIDADLNHFNEIYPQLNHDDQSNYYDIDTFNKIKYTSNEDLTIIHLNIRSLSRNFDAVHTLFCALVLKFDIICFTESWLTDSTKSLYTFENYRSFHSLRTNDAHGGVSVYVRDCFNVQELSHISVSLPFIESLFLKICYESKQLTIGTIYKPPSVNYSVFTDCLQDFVMQINDINRNDLFLCGDFNFNLLNSDNDAGTSYFINCLNTLSLIPLITKPTRISKSSGTSTLIDNIFSTSPYEFLSGILLSNISDHLPVFLIKRKCFTNKSHVDNLKNTSVKYRYVDDESLRAMQRTLRNHNFQNIIDNSNPDEAIKELSHILYSTYNNCCPIKTKTLSKKFEQKPWITYAIFSNIKKREAYYILYMQNKIPEHLFKKFRNLVTKQIRMSKKQYFLDKFNNFKDNTKATWNLINKILRPSGSNKKKNSIKTIVHNDTRYESNADMANVFNEFFVNIGRTIAESCNASPFDPLHYMQGDYPNSFFLKAVTPQDVGNSIKSLKDKKCDLYSVPVKIIKSVCDIVSPVIASIINGSFESGIFPQSLKIARVIPIPKTCEAENISNYRPISILPMFSKIFEKIAYIQLYNYLEKHDILYRGQYGFRSKKSTVQAVLDQMNFLYQNLDSDQIVLSIFLDFRKAFDSVDHTILLSKLRFYGIRGLTLDWFRSYLFNRQQYTVINDCKSNLLNISHGVPQGSILGPLLFLVFINDLPNSSNLFKCILFADDSTLSASFSRADMEIAIKINNELVSVNSWLDTNKICMNADKTKVITFSYKRHMDIPLLKIGNANITEVDSIKFLGMHLDRHLTFKYYVDYISTKISKSIGILYKLKYFLPPEVLKIIYFSLVQPYIYYGIEAWFASHKNVTDKMVVMQKKACRAINNLSYTGHTSIYFKSMNILKIEDLYCFQILVYMYKTVHLDHDRSLLEHLRHQSDIHPHSTRNRESFNITRFNKAKSQFSIIYKGVKLWNSIPNIIKSSNSLFTFKSKLKQHFVSHY